MPVRLVQMWVLPDTEGIDPGYEQRWVGDALAGGASVAVVLGAATQGVVALHQP